MMIPNACSILEVSSLMEHMNEEQITVTWSVRGWSDVPGTQMKRNKGTNIHFDISWQVKHMII